MFQKWALGILAALILAVGSYTVGRADAAMTKATEAATKADAVGKSTDELRADMRALIARLDRILDARSDARRTSATGGR